MAFPPGDPMLRVRLVEPVGVNEAAEGGGTAGQVDAFGIGAAGH